MRGGKFQAHSSHGDGVTVRNAEALFQAKSVVEIREVEAQTRNAIEEKKEELGSS